MTRISIYATCRWLWVGCCFLAWYPAAIADQSDGDRNVTPQSRTFRIDYGARLTKLPRGSRVRVWLPVPPSTASQSVKVLATDLPVRGMSSVEPAYGNQVLYFEVEGPKSGSVDFTTSYLVRRSEIRAKSVRPAEIELTAAQRSRFLSANRMVPLVGKQLTLLDELPQVSEPLSVARALYDLVDDHVRYDKSKPGYGNGDVLWVCDSRFGNCTDFHSLFISLARARGLPARFEIGFPLPPARGQGPIGGYHCWAFFHCDQNGWVPVDISEADKHPPMKDYYFGNLTENRVTFTIGRDIDLVPKQDGDPLNYFVVPYVEVDGEPWPKDKTQLAVSFDDVSEPGTP